MLNEDHQITKIITKRYPRYLCKECNTSYPNVKMVLDDHPGFNTNNFIILDKRNGHGVSAPEGTTNNLTLPQELICYD